MPKRATKRVTNYKSGFERALATSLKKRKVRFEYETLQLPYKQEHIYNPDFILENGIIIEAKGVLRPEDRTKMTAIRKQYPSLDIRFVFACASNKLTRAKSSWTYGRWAENNGFPWAEGDIPQEWIDE